MQYAETAPGCAHRHSCFIHSQAGFSKVCGCVGLQAGSITVPAEGRMFYLSQRPYLVSGSLRDQLLYPQPPRLVWQNASKVTKAKYNTQLMHMHALNLFLPMP